MQFNASGLTRLGERGNVEILLENTKFHFDKTLEIDDLLMTQDGLLFVECKSYVKSKDLEDLER